MAKADVVQDTPWTGADTALAFTLCARLCHDLAGTAGALAGTLDMVEADPDALGLAKDCAHDLSARLRLLRVAWGTDGDVAEWRSLVAGLPGAERLEVDLSGLAGLPATPPQLLANLLLIAAQALPRGGRIGVSAEGACLVLEISGARAAWPAALAECLAGPDRLRDAATSHRNVGVAVTCLLARAAGRQIVLDGTTRLRLGCSAGPR